MARKLKLVDSHIPDDIVVQILQWNFPPKTLGRFLCVSKKWRSIILEKIQEEELLLISSSSIRSIDFTEPETKAVTLLQYPTEDNFYVVGSANGLLLCLDRANTALNLFNPWTQTRQTIQTPDFPKPLTHENYVYGLGYDKNNYNYIIVIIDRENHNGFTWSSDAQIWVPFSSPFDLGFWSGPYCMVLGLDANGYIYWKTKFGVLCFELKTRNFKVIEEPPITKLDVCYLKFDVWGDRLVGLESVFIRECCTKVWELGEQMQWIKIMTITPFEPDGLVLPVLRLKNGDLVLVSGTYSHILSEARFYLYSQERKTFTKWDIQGSQERKIFSRWEIQASIRRWEIQANICCHDMIIPYKKNLLSPTIVEHGS